jgi:hypothetical protein
MHTEFWWGNLKEEDDIGRRRLKWKDSIKINLRGV